MLISENASFFEVLLPYCFENLFERQTFPHPKIGRNILQINRLQKVCFFASVTW